MAHVFFMQESKFKDAIRYYDPIVKRLLDSVLDVTAIVLGALEEYARHKEECATLFCFIFDF